MQIQNSRFSFASQLFGAGAKGGTYHHSHPSGSTPANIAKNTSFTQTVLSQLVIIFNNTEKKHSTFKKKWHFRTVVIYFDALIWKEELLHHKRKISLSVNINVHSSANVFHALVPTAPTLQGANEISMFIQMFFPSPRVQFYTTCVNMWLHTSATICAPEITAAQIELLFFWTMPKQC